MCESSLLSTKTTVPYKGACFFCESSLLRTNHITRQRGMLHTAFAEVSYTFYFEETRTSPRPQDRTLGGLHTAAEIEFNPRNRNRDRGRGRGREWCPGVGGGAGQVRYLRRGATGPMGRRRRLSGSGRPPVFFYRVFHRVFFTACVSCWFLVGVTEINILFRLSTFSSHARV